MKSTFTKLANKLTGKNPRMMVITDQPKEIINFLSAEVAKTYRKKGLIKSATVHELDCCSSEFLEAQKYVAHTCIAFGKALKAAAGGVLVIRNAHAVETFFNNSAVLREFQDSLLMLAAHARLKKDTVIILAGPGEPLRKFLASGKYLKKAYKAQISVGKPKISM